MEIVNSKSHEVGRPNLGATKPSLVGMSGGPGTTSIEMTIPGAKVGLIIGKGGETIRNLQDKSGTKMFILQENMFEECDKPLRIVGEPDLVEVFKLLYD
jgi:far upstream element-binding protein